MKPPIPAVLILICSVLSTSCGLIKPYTVTLNNNVLYSPSAERNSEDVLADTALQGCLNQTMAENEFANLENVTLLSCPNSGVGSLVGIGALPNLTRLDLSGNNISELGPLAELENLRVLNLADNRLRSAATLSNLPLLTYLDLSGNSELPCRQLNGLQERLGESLGRPLDCI